jgi:DNA repair exonuclease SbcCD ATPase subunit
MRIDDLTISNFRGFHEKREIPLGANVVIIRGPNGSGKTSLLDAIQWLLLGDVPRLAPSVLKKDEDYISNRYASGPPFVEAHLGGEDEDPVRLSRRGIGKAMQVQVDLPEGQMIGDAAQRWLNETMSSKASGLGETDLLRRYLLQQDDMREFLGADTKERYEFIAALTGMERLTSLEEQMSEELKAARKSVRDLVGKLKAAKGELESAKASVSNARELASQREERIEVGDTALRARDHLGVSDLKDGDAAVLAALRERSGTLTDQLEQLLELDRREARARERQRELAKDPAQRIAEIEKENEALRGSEEKRAPALAECEADLVKARAAAGKAQQLAALALEQIEGPCPVCEQEHDVDATRAHLTELLDAAPALAGLTETVERQRAGLAEDRLRLANLESELLRLRAEAEQRQQAQDLLDQVLEARQETRSALHSLIGAEAGSVSDPDLVVAAESSKREIDALASTLQRAADAELRSRQATKRVQALGEQVGTREQRLLAITTELAADKGRVKSAERVRTSLGKKVTEVMSEVANGSTKLINEIYASLDVHPTFREFGFHTQRHFETGHLRPWVYDRRRETDGNALHVLSAAQLNSLAICLFLALNLEHDARLRTAILDDPVQSLDDVNLLSLADVLRTVRGRRQVIVSTHDQTLAELLMRKLRPLRAADSTAVVTLDQWGESGPRVTPEKREAASLEPELELLADAAS